MSWQSASVRYVSIGEKSARFRDLTLPFTADEVPVESVIWLPNGGGKSSLMSLKSAVVLPGARDFTGAGREDGQKRPRKLEDYVANGDTSHTVIEWTRDDPGSLFGGRHRLLTGAVYEWPDRHRPTLEQGASLNKLWWSAVPAAGILDLDTLPVRDGRLLTLKQFRDRIRTLNTAHPELLVQFATTQAQWEEQLAALGIDTALYRYQARMNTSEGGIAKVFNFNSVRDFIDLVVDVIATPKQAAACGKVVTEHAKNLFRRPALLTESAFLGEARVLLEQLDAAHQMVQAATTERDATRQSAGRLRHSLIAAVAVHQARAELNRSRAHTFQQQATEARAERGRVDAVRAELLVLATTQEHADAGQALTDAQDAHTRARTEQTAWAAAAPLAEGLTHDAAAEQLREQLKPERAAREELRRRTDAFAVAAQALLTEQADAFEQAAAEAGQLLERATAKKTALKEKLRDVRAEEGELSKAESAARARLDAHGREIAAALRAGHLTSGQDLTVALTERAAAAAAAEDAKREHGASEKEHREAAARAGAEAGHAALEHHTLAGEAREAAAEERALIEAHGHLARHPRLAELAELGEEDELVDVWGDATRLRRRLEEAARSAEAAVLRAAVDSAEDVRLLDAVDATGLLPAPVATLAVVDTLTGSGLSAQTAWTVLARDYDEAARSRVAATRPDAASGVVVQDPASRDRARALLTSSPTLAHIPLVTAHELAEAATGSVPDEASHAATAPSAQAVPLHDGLHRADAARGEAHTLRGRGQSRQQDQQAHTERAAADRALQQQLDEFLHVHPDAGALDRAAQARQLAHEAAERKLAEAGEHTQRQKDEVAAAEAERERGQQAGALAESHRAAVTVLTRLVNAAASLEEDRLTVEHAAATLATLRTDTARLEEQQEQVDAEVADAREVRQARLWDAEAARKTRADVRVLEPADPPAAAAVDQARQQGLTQCLASYQTLTQQWQVEAGGSALEAQLKAEEERAAAARQRAQHVLTAGTQGDADPADADRVRELAERRAAGHDSDTCAREAQAAQRTLEDAIDRQATARTKLDQAKAGLETATAERATRPRVSDPVPFTTVDDARDRAARLARRVTELTAAETEHNRRRDQANLDAEAEEALAENLQDQADRLPTLPRDVGAGVAAEPEPFPGDLPEGRARVKAALDRAGTAAEKLDTALGQRAEYTNQALRLANHGPYQALQLTLRERLADAAPERLGAKAAEYVTEVSTRLSHVEGLLTQIGQDERKISQVVATHVRQLLSAIAAANRASVLPPGLGDLSGKQFLHLRFNDPSPDELASRVTQEILAMLDAAHGETKSLPSGETILRRSVHAAAGVKGFRVHVLKPNEHMLEQKVEVVDVARFSDGEKLTACVLLFCAFARMRQSGPSGRVGGATGTLMLDNPFGRASNAQLVALQLAVAKAQRVHLVYATGLEDMGALLQFRRLIRLRNRKPVGSTDGHVQLEDASAAARVGEVSGVSVARPSAPVPPGLDVVSDS